MIYTQVKSFWKCYPKSQCLLGLSLFGKHNEFDMDKKINMNNGWTRIKNIFKVDQSGYHTPQYKMIKDSGYWSANMAGFLGGIRYAVIARDKFNKNKEGKSFISKHEVGRKFLDQVFLGFFRGCFAAAFKGLIATTIVMSSIIFISEFRESNGSFLDFTLGTGLSGMIYRFHKGPGPMMGGGIYGAGLGSMIGLFSYSSGINLKVVYQEMQDDIDVQKRARGEFAIDRPEEEILGLLPKST